MDTKGVKRMASKIARTYGRKSLAANQVTQFVQQMSKSRGEVQLPVVDKVVTAKTAEDEPIEQGDSSNPLVNIDSAADNIVAGIITIQENLPHLDLQGNDQRRAVAKIKELLDNSLSPYVADLLKLLDTFETDEK